MNKQQNDITKGIVKRIGVTILCCLPALIIIGYWLRGLNSPATVAIFTLFMLVVVCIEEYLHLKIATKKELIQKTLHKNEDVFK